MVKAEFVTEIARPVGEVFAYLADVENETQWQPDLVEARLTSPGPVAVGAQGRDVRKFMGREVVTTWEVTEFEPDQRMTFKVITGPMPFSGSLVFEPDGNGTRLVYLVQAETSGISKLFDPLVSRVVSGQGRKQMAALKRVLEEQR